MLSFFIRRKKFNREADFFEDRVVFVENDGPQTFYFNQLYNVQKIDETLEGKVYYLESEEGLERPFFRYELLNLRQKYTIFLNKKSRSLTK